MASVETMRSAFEDIYSKDVWRGGSGPGSSPVNTAEYRAFVQRFMHDNGVRTVTDLGCGDWQFSRLIDWSGVRYTGLDLVPHLITSNESRYGGPGVTFRVLETIDDLPGGDLLLCKEVLQHLPNAAVADYLRHIRKKYRLALLTNFVLPEQLVNSDIAPGRSRPLRLERPPFSAPGAVVMTYHPQDGRVIFKNHVFLMFGAP